MRVLYVGSDKGVSGHRYAALQRLGNEVTLLDPEAVVSPHRLVAFWMWRVGPVGIVEHVRRRLIPQVEAGRYDVAWVDHGHLISDRFVRALKERVPVVLCYNTDDPFGGRDMRLWTQHIKAVPNYDLMVVVREVNVQEAYAAGAKRVMHVLMSADEVVHAPRQLSPEEYRRWHSEVLFVGTAFAERGPFIADLIKRGVPVSIYGNQWQQMRDWPSIEPHWRGPGLSHADDYCKAIAAADICLGLLSKGNRDLHTTRSMEIPALGSVLCAERTVEHSALYQEGEEAVFWDDAGECARVCRALLADEAWRKSVARRGHARYLRNGWRNMQVAADVLRIAGDGGEESLREYHQRLPGTAGVLLR